MTHDQIKEYLLEHNITSEEELAQHIEVLKHSEKNYNDIVFPLVDLLLNEKSVLNSFFRENEEKFKSGLLKIINNSQYLGTVDTSKGDIVGQIKKCFENYKTPDLLGYNSQENIGKFDDVKFVLPTYERPIDMHWEALSKYAQDYWKIDDCKGVDLGLTSHIKFTLLEENTITEKEQERLSRNHLSTRHKASSPAFHLDEILEDLEKKEAEQEIINQLEDKTDAAFKKWLEDNNIQIINFGGDLGKVVVVDLSKNNYGSIKTHEGVKESQAVQKAPIFTYCKVNKNALEQLALRALYGHEERYKDTDQDWQNFTRVTNGDFEYANAQFRHALDIGEEDEETHLIASAWNAVARLEIFLREKNKKQ